MGTRLIAAGLDLTTDDPCLWNQSHPETILELHQRDVAAGAEVDLHQLVWGEPVLARSLRQRRSGRSHQLARLFSLAREAAGPDRFVVGSIGPTAAADEATLWGK